MEDGIAQIPETLHTDLKLIYKLAPRVFAEEAAWVMARRVTLADIAAAAGTSTTAVSLVLNGQGRGRVGAELAEKIRRTAERLGYRPDPALRALLAHRESKRAKHAYRKVGLVISAPTEEDWRKSPFHQGVFTGFTERAAELGFGVARPIFGQPEAAVIRRLRARGVDGLLLAQPAEMAEPMETDWQEFALVGIGSAMARSPFTIIGPDHQGNMRMLADQLFKAGHRRIAYLPQRVMDEGLKSLWMNWADGAAREDPRWLGAIRRVRSVSALLAWCRQHQPDALLTADPWARIVPDHLRPPCAGYSLGLENRSVEAGGIFQRPKEIGRAALELLDLNLRNNILGIQAHAPRLLVPGEWIPPGKRPTGQTRTDFGKAHPRRAGKRQNGNPFSQPGHRPR